MKKLSRRLLSTCLLTAVLTNAQALTYELPPNGSTVIGEMSEARTVMGDSLTSLGRRYSLGIMELKEANPSLKPDTVFPPGMDVTLPTFYILPNAPHKGIVINIAELRLYFYAPGTREVMTFPVGIGRQGWDTPLGETFIAQKQKDPTWVVPKTIQAARLEDGVVLDDSVPPGPANPLGGFRLRLGLPSILIHGSNDPSGIGRRSSSGCIRMQPEAIESFFDRVYPRMPVFIVDEPIKTGWLNNDLYIEVHIPVEDDLDNDTDAMTAKMHKLVEAVIAKRPAKIDWDTADEAVKAEHGYPVKIGEGTGSEPKITVPLNPSTPVAVKNQVHKRETKPHHHLKFF